MTIRQKHFDAVQHIFVNGLALMEGKNTDYAKEEDPYSNFRLAANAAGITINRGILFLVGIKLARIENILGASKVNNESLEDSIVDAVNYLGILGAYEKLKNEIIDDYPFAPSDDEVPEGEDAAWSGEAEPAPSLGEKLKAFLFPPK